MQTIEERAEPGSRQIRLLSFVLQYDDLLSETAESYDLGEARSCQIERADEAGIPAFHEGRLKLHDRWLSRVHASIERRGHHDVLVDKGSRNGTYLNGQRITEQVLCDGDLIELGHSLLCYRKVDAADAAVLATDSWKLGPTRTLCPELAVLLRHLQRIAPSSESVLLLGETGAGKEICAEMIHNLSGRKGAFSAIDCGAIPESLFESTLFGHTRGAFTDATASRSGEIARARGGTMFLDEVGNMGAACQAKLLRVVETGRVTPLGGSESERPDVRWISATNEDLQREGSPFRPDLLRRLASFTARIPPLRKRREDLGLLTAYLLKDAGVKKAAISATAARRLYNGRFSGNVRQLRSVLRSAALLAREGTIEIAHLGEMDTAPEPSASSTPGSRKDPSREDIEAALTSTSGNVIRAARQLNAHPRQLYRWIDRFQVPLEQFRR